ncbi:MAG: hypothetical protein GF350_03600 [Chitinivibrionales bacterium]|nr:hypothetical protein [Chitinivibrionales bacterium]
MLLSIRIIIPAVSIAALVLGCSDSNPSGGLQQQQAGPSELRFQNACTTTSIIGTKTTYTIRNIAALDSLWNEEVDFGEYSSYKVINPHSTDFTVECEFRPDSGGDWRELKWTERINPDTGGPFTVELSIGD